MTTYLRFSPRLFPLGWSVEMVIVVQASQQGPGFINWRGKAGALAGIHENIAVEQLLFYS